MCSSSVEISIVNEKRLHIKNSPGCTIELRNLFWDTEIAGRSDVPIQYYCRLMLLPSP